MSGEPHIYLYISICSMNTISSEVHRCTSLEIVFMLQNRSHICHNEYDVVPNQWRVDCLLNHVFRHRSQKISKLCVTGLCEGNSPVTGELPAKGPVTRKMFPFHDVFMNQWHLHVSLSQTGGRVICLESHGDKGILFRFVSYCIKGLWWWYIAKTLENRYQAQLNWWAWAKISTDDMRECKLISYMVKYISVPHVLKINCT